MSKGSEFLENVSGRISQRLDEVRQTIEDVKQDIHEMNDYYWENYTEMDEYGYENYDNQQALKMQVDANQENRKLRHRLEKMLDSPFFGSVTFRYEDDEEEDEPADFYIGIGNFAERAGDVPLIYDWRAPVSSLFYDYDKGEASYEAPGGTMEGEVLSKWQYKIRGGRMVYEFESDFKIDDEVLKQELGKNGDVKLKNIIRTIQKEQNAIIRNTKDKVMIIQGAAGSGKTSIALHRIAYLLYHDRKRLSSANVLVLSPNSVFADYISHILPELGEENIREMSLDLFAYRELHGIVDDCEDRYHQVEKEIALERAWREAEKVTGGEPRAKRKKKKYLDAKRRYAYKQSKQLTDDMEGFLIELEDRIVNFADVTYKKMTLTEAELRTLFYDKFTSTPLMSRMDSVTERFIDEYETLYKDLSDDEKVVIKEKFDRMYVTRDLYTIYSWFLKEMHLPQLPPTAPENRVLAHEDVYPMLYMKYRLKQPKVHRDVRHLVVDEMQDYSYLQYMILDMLFPCSKTILGDRAQTIDGEQQDVLTFLPRMLGKETRVIEINKSYRNTLEVAEYADRICPIDGIEYFERHGKPVEEIEAVDAETALEDILGKIRLADAAAVRAEEDALPEQMPEDGPAFETAAVLAMTEAEAKTAYEWLKARRDDVHYIDRDSSLFCKGVTVTTFYLAKGLEFDQVFAIPADPELSLYKQYQYISATRALHELYVYK
jgi:DNA helicase-2/ATP-dependent DNA helicase PcrA